MDLEKKRTNIALKALKAIRIIRCTFAIVVKFNDFIIFTDTFHNMLHSLASPNAHAAIVMQFLPFFFAKILKSDCGKTAKSTEVSTDLRNLPSFRRGMGLAHQLSQAHEPRIQNAVHLVSFCESCSHLASQAQFQYKNNRIFLFQFTVFSTG